MCIQGIFTIMRDHTTSREDFIFFTDRLSTFLGEKAMEFLPYSSRTVSTPVGATYAGKHLAVDVSVSPPTPQLTLRTIQHVCGISILRSYVASYFPISRTVIYQCVQRRSVGARTTSRLPGYPHGLAAHPVRRQYRGAAPPPLHAAELHTAAPPRGEELRLPPRCTGTQLSSPASARAQHHRRCL